MGYRSDVAIAVYGDESAMTEFKQYFNDQIELLDDDSKEWLDSMLSDSEAITGFELFNETSMVFQAEWVKWYDESCIVQFFNTICKHAPTLGLSGESLRIGEDVEDIEHRSFGENPEYVLSVSRSISISI